MMLEMHEKKTYLGHEKENVNSVIRMPQQQLSQYHSINLEHQSLNVQENSVRPRILFALNATIITQGTYPLDLEFLPSELQLNNGFYVGTLIPQNYYGALPALLNVPVPYNFGLDLDHYVISQLEKFRDGKDLQCQMLVRYIAKGQAPQPFSTSSQMNLPIRIPKSDWVEMYLPKLKFRDVLLLEFPKLDGSDFKEAVDHLNNAWRQYGFGEYDKVLEECRMTLETTKELLKKKSMLKENEVDWKQILQSETAGEYVSSVFKSAWGYNSRGAHIGKSINREDADFSLLTTYALLGLLTKKIT
jgi:hypothetical protein